MGQNSAGARRGGMVPMLIHLRSLIVAGLIALAWPVAAQAACTGQFPSGYACGNAKGSQADPTGTALPAMFDAGFGAPSAQGTILNRGSSAWNATSTPVLGKPGTTTGSVGLASASGGTTTIQPAAISSNTLFQFPSTNGTNGYTLATDGAGHSYWSNPASGGTVTSVGLSLPSAIFAVTGSPVTVIGTLTGTLQTQSANLVWAGPISGSAAAPTFRSLVGPDLPNPSTTSLGGIQAIAAVTSNWINSISNSGVPALSQPAFTDISGIADPSQLPNPTASTLGGVRSIAAQTSKWINTISTSGVPGATQPAFTDISGTIVPSQLPVVSNNTVLANITGGSTAPSPVTTTALLDATIGNVQGDILYRNATAWVVLAPGTSGQVFTTGGAAANPSWVSVSGTGTVTEIDAGAGITLSPSPITSSGSVALSSIANNTVLANVSGSSAAPSSTTPTAILDVIGSTEGDILYRGASAWSVLGPGTTGQVLQTQGAGSTPQWANASTVSSVGIAAAGGLTSSGDCTITTSGTCTLYSPGGYLNKFRNGTFTVWQRGISSLPTNAYTADGWVVGQPGATGSCSRGETTATATPLGYPLYVIGCAGATGNTNTYIYQHIESFDAAPMAGQTVTVQFQFYQGSGSTVTPQLQTFYPTATDNWTAATTDLVTNLTPCATGTWCTESYTFAVSANAANGYQVVFYCNTALTAGQSCYVGAADIRVTPGVATGINLNPPPPEMRSVAEEAQQCRRYYYTGFAYNYGYNAAGNLLLFYQTFPVTMRTLPTMAYNNVSYDNVSGLTLIPVYGGGPSNTWGGVAGMYSYSTVGATGGAFIYFWYTASADL